jgi:hypothetical protein
VGWWGCMPRHFADFGLSGASDGEAFFDSLRQKATRPVWFWLPLGSVISNALFCVMEAEDWNLMPFFFLR